MKSKPRITELKDQEVERLLDMLAELKAEQALGEISPYIASRLLRRGIRPGKRTQELIMRTYYAMDD